MSPTQQHKYAICFAMLLVSCDSYRVQPKSRRSVAKIEWAGEDSGNSSQKGIDGPTKGATSADKNASTGVVDKIKADKNASIGVVDKINADMHSDHRSVFKENQSGELPADGEGGEFYAALIQENTSSHNQPLQNLSLQAPIAFEDFPHISDPEKPFFGCGYIEASDPLPGSKNSYGDWVLRQGIKISVQPWSFILFSGAGFHVTMHWLQVRKGDRGETRRIFGRGYTTEALKSKIVGRSLRDLDLDPESLPGGAKNLMVKLSIMLDETMNTVKTLVIAIMLGKTDKGWVHAATFRFQAGGERASPDRLFKCDSEERGRVDGTR